MDVTDDAYYGTLLPVVHADEEALPERIFIGPVALHERFAHHGHLHTVSEVGFVEAPPALERNLQRLEVLPGDVTDAGRLAIVPFFGDPGHHDAPDPAAHNEREPGHVPGRFHPGERARVAKDTLEKLHSGSHRVVLRHR